jgi:microcystin-dependent protein
MAEKLRQTVSTRADEWNNRPVTSGTTKFVLLWLLTVLTPAVVLCGLWGGTAFYYDFTQDENLRRVNSTLGARIDAVGDRIDLLNATLLDKIAHRIAFINEVGPDLETGIVNLIGMDGITVTNNATTHTLTLTTNAVRTIEGQAANETTGNVDLTGAGGLTVTAGPAGNEITLDTSTLQTAISNLEMLTAMHSSEIAALQVTDLNLQSQINALTSAGDLVSEALNGTTTSLNMTVMELLVDVLMLRSDVTALQSAVAALQNSVVQTGTILPHGGAIVPTGFLACDGALLNTTEYAALFAVISYTYCPSAGPNAPCDADNFALPDLTGRIPVGKKSSGAFGTSGAALGEEVHTLTSGELATHTHTGSSSTASAHSHNVWMRKAAGYNGNSYVVNPYGSSGGVDDRFGTSFDSVGPTNTGVGTFPITKLELSSAFSVLYAAGGSSAADYNGAEPSGSHSHTMALNNAGSSTPFNVVQPSLVVPNYIIKF